MLTGFIEANFSEFVLIQVSMASGVLSDMVSR